MIQFLRYSFASFCALIVDYSTYILLVNIVLLQPEIVASLSYLFGLTIAYILLKLFVFNFDVKYTVKTERLLFFISGLIGTIVTYFVTKISIIFFGNVFIAKGIAVLFSFIIVYLFRKLYVFKKA